MIDDSETVIQVPHRLVRDRRGRVPPSAIDDERVSVTIRDRRQPWPLRLYFASLAPDAPLLGVEFGSEDSVVELDLGHVARMAGNLALYEQYARAEIQFEHGEVRKALTMLSNIGATRRGLPGKFFRIIAEEHNARREAGETAPVTALAVAHGVSKSTASRWITEARRRGLIEDEA